VTPLNVAEMLTGVDAVTAAVAMEKLPVVAPAFTVAEPGTAAAALLLESATAAALEGAALNVTVPCAAVPPWTLAGLTLTLVRVGGGGGGGGVLGDEQPRANTNAVTAAAPAAARRID
jgi:hypothetical protein